MKNETPEYRLAYDIASQKHDYSCAIIYKVVNNGLVIQEEIYTKDTWKQINLLEFKNEVKKLARKYHVNVLPTWILSNTSNPSNSKQ